MECSAKNEFPERQIQLCEESRCGCKVEREDLHLIEQDRRGVRMQMHIVDGEYLDLSFYREYCNTLQKAGYADLQILKQHLTIEHIIKTLSSQQLCKRMMDSITWRKNENFSKGNF